MASGSFEWHLEAFIMYKKEHIVVIVILERTLLKLAHLLKVTHLLENFYYIQLKKILRIFWQSFEEKTFPRYPGVHFLKGHLLTYEKLTPLRFYWTVPFNDYERTIDVQGFFAVVKWPN